MIELLTLLAIVGALAALLLTTVVRGRGSARRIQCANNVRQLGMALRAFLAENHSYPLLINPPQDNWMTLLQNTELPVSGRSTNHITFHQWARPGVWRCPAADKPSDWPTNRGYLSYGYNWYGMSAPTDIKSLGLGGHFTFSNTRLPIPAVQVSEVASPGEMIAIGDGFVGGKNVIEDGAWMLWRTYGVADYLGSTKRAYLRHQGNANVVFCDGHVESPTLKFLFADTNDAALVRWNRDHLPHREKLSP